MRDHLVESGVDVRLNASAATAFRRGADSVLGLDDGTEVAADAVVFGTGRKPRTDGLGADRAGAELGGHGEIV